jgi:hypothetical protein
MRRRIYNEKTYGGKQMIKLKCPKCKKVWEYKGKNSVTATCPDCMRKINIEESKVKN